jgi:hypothetical protein
LQPVFGWFLNILKVRQPATQLGAQSKQPQLMVRLHPVVFDPVSVVFLVASTGPANTIQAQLGLAFGFGPGQAYHYS